MQEGQGSCIVTQAFEMEGLNEPSPTTRTGRATSDLTFEKPEGSFQLPPVEFGPETDERPLSGRHAVWSDGKPVDQAGCEPVMASGQNRWQKSPTQVGRQTTRVGEEGRIEKQKQEQIIAPGPGAGHPGQLIGRSILVGRPEGALDYCAKDCPGCIHMSLCLFLSSQSKPGVREALDQTGLIGQRIPSLDQGLPEIR